ncbi:hypothetical protein CSUI_008863 [Cystoisospora suis]|uniref:Transmembrane protein n=1 Tax=Cystoisospora suis TaxID=483139 RepID=A0A2C6KID2_9APIC|nr:hypothetical protein CSUI_008863 [Cystoisospora suis]
MAALENASVGLTYSELPVHDAETPAEPSRLRRRRNRSRGGVSRQLYRGSKRAVAALLVFVTLGTMMMMWRCGVLKSQPDTGGLGASSRRLAGAPEDNDEKTPGCMKFFKIKKSRKSKKHVPEISEPVLISRTQSGHEEVDYMVVPHIPRGANATPIRTPRNSGVAESDSDTSSASRSSSPERQPQPSAHSDEAKNDPARDPSTSSGSPLLRKEQSSSRSSSTSSSRESSLDSPPPLPPKHYSRSRSPSPSATRLDGQEAGRSGSSSSGFSSPLSRRRGRSSSPPPEGAGDLAETGSPEVPVVPPPLPPKNRSSRSPSPRSPGDDSEGESQDEAPAKPSFPPHRSVSPEPQQSSDVYKVMAPIPRPSHSPNQPAIPVKRVRALTPPTVSFSDSAGPAATPLKRSRLSQESAADPAASPPRSHAVAGQGSQKRALGAPAETTDKPGLESSNVPGTSSSPRPDRPVSSGGAAEAFDRSLRVIFEAVMPLEMSRDRVAQPGPSSSDVLAESGSQERLRGTRHEKQTQEQERREPTEDDWADVDKLIKSPTEPWQYEPGPVIPQETEGEGATAGTSVDYPTLREQPLDPMVSSGELFGGPLPDVSFSWQKIAEKLALVDGILSMVHPFLQQAPGSLGVGLRLFSNLMKSSSEWLRRSARDPEFVGPHVQHIVKMVSALMRMVQLIQHEDIRPVPLQVLVEMCMLMTRAAAVGTTVMPTANMPYINWRFQRQRELIDRARENPEEYINQLIDETIVLVGDAVATANGALGKLKRSENV